MRTIKYLISFSLICTFCTLFFSCMDEDDYRKTGTRDGKSIELILSTPEQTVISPLTKSGEVDTLVRNLVILIYDKNSQLLPEKSRYVTEGLSPLNEGKSSSIPVELFENAEGYVYVLANAANILESSNDYNSKIQTVEGLKAITFKAVDAIGTPRPIMYAEGQYFNVNTANSVQLELVRIYAMVTVKVVKDLDPAKNVDVRPISLQIKHIPSQGQLVANNKIGENGAECVIDGDVITRSSETEENFLSKSHNEAHPFYMYENCQPKGKYSTDQTTKTPHGYETSDPATIIKTDRKCSYIEIKADYINGGNINNPGSGNVTYRFFLGEDALEDFTISRNYHYQITLTLKGDGGIKEATWRVEKVLKGSIAAPDVFVGYRAGSRTRMYVIGDVEYVKNISVETTHTPTGGQAGFTLGSSTLQEDEFGQYVDIYVTYTNVHSYDKKIGTVTFTLTGENFTKTQTAKVYQVPRLVDPIAIYKRALNDSAVVVTVKEFIKDYKNGHGGYITLSSKGKWTATIESTNGENWFELYTLKDGVKDGANIASRVNQSIEGEGEVVFTYKPKDKNFDPKGDGNDGTIGGARFGKIVVKYHNAWCQHEIFVRQGYQPTKLGDTKYAWSSYNCLGIKNAADTEGPVTQYPTQSGWLFLGGINIAMHPFEPGYRIGYSDDNQTIEYSDGSYGRFFEPFKNRWNITAWQSPQTEVESMAVPQRGPCPAGYVVATAWAYRKMSQRDISDIYTGYVHDDSPSVGESRGWNYETLSDDGGAILYGGKYNMNCNPAKGSLFVSKSDECTNVFFNYGKGVLTQTKEVDPVLIPEIGVGHRFTEDHAVNNSDYRFGHLTYTASGGDKEFNKSHGYGAYYWSGSPFSGTHLGKVDLAYDIFTPYPSLIDEPGCYVDNDPNIKAAGIRGDVHGSFLRCVYDPNYTPSNDKTTKVLASFYEQSTGGTNVRLMTTTSILKLKIDGVEKLYPVSEGIFYGDLTYPRTLSEDANVIEIINCRNSYGNSQIGTTTITTSISALKNPNTKYIFVNPDLAEKRSVTIAAKFKYMSANYTGNVIFIYKPQPWNSNELGTIAFENGLAKSSLGIPDDIIDTASANIYMEREGATRGVLVSINDLTNPDKEISL